MWPFTPRKTNPEPMQTPREPVVLRKADALPPIKPNRRMQIVRSGVPSVEYDNRVAVKKAVEHPVMQRALRFVSRAVQVVDWYAVETGTSTQTTRRAVKQLNDLLENPNNEYTPSMLRYWLAVNLAAYGKATFKVGVTDKLPIGIYPLNAEFTQVRVDARGRITGFEYGSQADKREFFPVREPGAFVDGGYGHQISFPNINADPSSPIDLIPLRAAGGPSTIITALLARTLATAQGHPNSKYLIAVKDDMDQAEKEDIEGYVEERETYGGSSGSVMFMNGEVEVHKLDSDLSDSHSKAPLDDMTRMIVGMFGIPISLWGLGAADSARYAGNYQESRASFYQDTIIPDYLTPIAEGMTRALCPPGVEILFDYDSIPAMLQSRMQTAATLNSVTFLTEEEKRTLMGFGKSKR